MGCLDGGLTTIGYKYEDVARGIENIRVKVRVDMSFRKLLTKNQMQDILKISPLFNKSYQEPRLREM